MKRVPYGRDVDTGEIIYVNKPETDAERAEAEKRARATPGFYAGFSELHDEEDLDEDEQQDDQQQDNL